MRISAHCARETVILRVAIPVVDSDARSMLQRSRDFPSAPVVLDVSFHLVRSGGDAEDEVRRKSELAGVHFSRWRDTLA